MTTERRVSRGVLWPCVVVAALVLTVAGNVALLLVAGSDPSFSVEPDYYRKAVAWDATMAQERHNRDLGWSVDLRISPEAGVAPLSRVRAVVLDRDGAPLEGAAVELEAFHGARAGSRVRASLEPQGTTAHAALLPLRRAGLWELRLTVRRGADVFTQTLHQEVARTQAALAMGGPR